MCRDSSVAVLGQGDRCPWYASRAGSSSCCPLCATTGALRSCSSSTWSSTPLSRCRGFPMVQTVRQTTGIHQLLHTVIDAPICRSCTLSCRDAEADLHGLVDHRHFPVLHRQGHRRSCCEGRTSFKCRRGGDSRAPVVRFMRHEVRSQVMVGSCEQAQGQGLLPPSEG